ncbi:hypothetical protein I308_105814 [Cryptococcus tetragattii IND107]|uniref:Rrp15p-domain-containing protein n=1 Tax=Cryptococcus tetragattii IND107 TaxID=1296105 RepID=A0ABR3BK65_9TREE|nr:hypothetical protein I308_06240 [Cryptococcus tetragattii IND107]
MSVASLKSALKKPTKSFDAPRAGPSKLSVAATVAEKFKPKSKQTVSIAKKPQRLRGPGLESESEGNASGFEDESASEIEADEDEEMNTDEEIEKAKEGKPKKSTKRKRAPTTAADFGATLTSLLADPLTKSNKKAKSADSNKKAAAAPILALSAHRLPTKASVSLEAKAKRQLRAEKEEKEDRARVQNILEGWSGDGVVGGQEFERNLRKTAQKGVVKLFNAILVASKNAEAAQTTLSEKARIKPEAAKKKEKDNILGRGGKEDVLTKESFLEMVRKGSSK